MILKRIKEENCTEEDKKVPIYGKLIKNFKVYKDCHRIYCRLIYRNFRFEKKLFLKATNFFRKNKVKKKLILMLERLRIIKSN